MVKPKEKDTVILAEFGIVVVERIYPTGSAVICDCQGERWLIDALTMTTAKNYLPLFD